MTDKAKILVIDDDQDIHEFCRLVLESAGYEVLVAYSGAEGKEIMNETQADLVILDVMMEQADTGFEAARWFASEYPNVPVIMLSSIADAADNLFDTSTLNVADLVNKPIAPQELVDKVARLLGACQ
ncbi:MAG: response regulator [Bradymonadales bacterium]|nr:response regulator [Bradymonadales bacterium]